MVAGRLTPKKSTWQRYFFYRKESWRTTWKFRLLVLVLGVALVMGTRRYWTGPFAQSLVCIHEEKTPHSDALLLENFDPDYLVFERAESLQRSGIASRAFVPTRMAEEGEPNAVDRGTVELMARIARLQHFEIVSTRQIEPISFNAAHQIRDVLVREGIQSVVVVSPGFRSRRSALIYSTVLTPAGIKVSCEPVFGASTTQNWTETWHGIQGVLEHFVKLQYYRFWVLR